MVLAVTVLLVLPAIFASPGFMLYYVLPLGGALVVSLVALRAARGRLASVSLVAATAVSVLLVLPGCAVS